MGENYIKQEFDGYSLWRQDLNRAISVYRDWLTTQKLADIQTDQRIEQVLSSLHDDKLYVAFVAEFSRGKSELINAIFFARLGSRVLPSSAGRTTMCPTELLHDETAGPYLRLLPIETRTSGTSIAEYKAYVEEWETLPLDMSKPGQVTDALAALTRTKPVTRQEAHNLGLSISEDSAHQEGLEVREDGLVEVPQWRHAIVNLPHPLLMQGLVLLDTPGLNALGAEPELTLGMLASAHAVLFVLAADTGVTKSDLAVWRDHLSVAGSSDKGRLVVLNKTDVLWDELRDRADVDSEIERQVQSTARILGVPSDSIFPVSAQKALLGRIRGDEELVDNSRLEELETALAEVLIPAKTEIVRDNVFTEMSDIVKVARGTITQRLKDVEDHIAELDKLNDKNVDVIEDMMRKVRSDKEHLEVNLQRFQATRSIFQQQTSRLYSYLSGSNLERLIAGTKKDMATSLTTAGLRATMLAFFAQTRAALDGASRQAGEIQALMDGVYRKLQEHHGITSIKPRRFSTSRYMREMKRLEERHENYIRGMSMVMTEQMVLTNRFYDSVISRTRNLFERASRDADNWLKTIMSPMESQVREHQVQLRRRLESIKRIHKARDTLEDRLAELHQVQDGIRLHEREMDGLVGDIVRALESPPESYVPSRTEVGHVEARQAK